MVDCGELLYLNQGFIPGEPGRLYLGEDGSKGARGYLEQYPPKETSTTSMIGLILAPTPALRRRLKEDRVMPALPYNQE